MTRKLLSLVAALAFFWGAQAELFISEICPKPGGFDPNGKESGWIELYNAGDEAVDLANYEIVRANRGKALAPAGKPLASRTVPAKGYTIVYANEVYDNAKDLGGDQAVKIYANDVMVFPNKINPKKYPLVALYKTDGTLLQTLVVPVELDDKKSFAPAGGVFASYTGAAATPAIVQPPAAVAIDVPASAVTTDAEKGITSVAATSDLAATNIWSLSFTFTLPTTAAVPGDKTGMPLFNAPGALSAYLGTDGQIEVTVGSETFDVDYDGFWTDGEPHTLTIVCGPTAESRVAVAVDGTTFIDRTTGVAAPLDTTKDLLFGQIADDGDWVDFTGSVSEVKLYTGAKIAIDASQAVVEAAQVAVPEAVTRVILPKPTKGAANNMTGAIAYGPNAGPLYGVKHSLADWKAFTVATNGQPYAVEMMVNPLTAAEADQIVNVTLVYREFKPSGMVEKTCAMAPLSTNATAGVTYGATIPAADVPAAGKLLQWAAIVTDAAGNSWRTPSCASAENGYEWYGTLVQPTASQTSAALPTWHLFAVQDTLDNMDKQKENITSTHPYGVYCGVYDEQTRLYYDHVLIDLRGNTTAGLKKKSHSLKFLKSQTLACTNPFDGEEISLRKTSLLAEYADPSRLRSVLSCYLRRQAGQDVPFCYPIRTQLNGAFYQLCFHTNRFTDEMFEDYFTGYDPLGRAFKNCGDADGVYCGGGVEQKLPDPDDYPSYVSEYNSFKSKFVSLVKKNHPTQAGMTAAEQAQVDKIVVQTFDLPGWLNFLALSRFTQECDDGWSTLCLYYDVNRTGTWKPMAYDLHQSFGAYYRGDNYGVAGPWADQDRAKCHPYYGGMRVVSGNYSNNISRANRAYECIYQSPKFRRLMARRLRTLMDSLLKAPGTAQDATPFWRDYAAPMVTAMQADDVLDRAKWGLGTGGQLYVWSSAMTFAEGVDDLWNNYIVKRRNHFFNTHSVTNTAFSGAGYGAEYNAMLPLAQSPLASLTNGFSIVNVNADGSFSDTEKVVIRNDNAEAVDMSGWTLDGTLAITLPAGTVVDANDTITIVSDRKAYVTDHSADLTDDVIVGNATVNAATTAIALKAADGTTVAQGQEPEEVNFTGDYTEPVTIQMPGEKEFNGANFNAGLTFGSGTYVVSVKKGSVNTATTISCAGTLILKGKGTLSLAGAGGDPLMTTQNLIVSNGTFKVVYDSTVAKSSAVVVNGYVLLDNTGTIDLTVSGTQGYGIALANKNTEVKMAAGDLKAKVSGTKCAAINLKGSCDGKFKGGTITAELAGTNAKVVNGGSQSFSGANATVTMPADITGMLEARPFAADKKITVSGGTIDVNVPAYGSEVFSTAEAAGTITISGGTLNLLSGDDCLSAFTDVNISGGLFYGTSISNDVIDANGNIAISGGTVLAYTTAVEEDGNGSFGLDVNEGNTITITGGTVVALGGKDAHIYGSPAGYSATNLNAADLSGKYLTVTGVTETAKTALAVKLPAIATSKCALLAYVPGVTAETAPVFGDTAPATGALDFHDVYLNVEEIGPAEPEPGSPLKLGAFRFAIPFTVSGYRGQETLTNFPVLVRLSANNPAGFSYDDCAADGSDLRFGDSEMNQLPHEIDTWNPAGESLVWVRLPELAQGTEFTMAYSGTPAAAVQATDVWPDYVGVWHMGEASGTARDATAHGLDAAPAGALADTISVGVLDADAPLGIARQNANEKGKKGSESAYLKAPSYDDLAVGDTFTVSGWVKFASDWNNSSTCPRIFCRKVAYNEAGGWHIELSKNSNNTPAVFGSGATNFTAPVADLRDTWVHLTFVYNGTTATVYSNGTLAQLGTITAATDNGKALALGSNVDGSEWALVGLMDEFRLRDAVNTGDWIQAEYDTVRGDTAFLTAGAVTPLAREKVVLSGFSVQAKSQTASLSVSLVQLGEGATQADLYLAYAPEGTALSTPEKVHTFTGPGAFTKRLANLVPETTYTMVFEAVNNAAEPKTTAITNTFTTAVAREKTPRPAFGTFANAIRFATSGYQGTETLTNYPVRVKLAENAPEGFFYADLAATGSDIRFADADGNPIPHEIDTWDTEGESYIWVKVPAVTKDTTFMMYYGGASEDANVPTATWSGFTGVWHMSEASGTVADATGHELTATPSGAGATAAGAQVAAAGVCGNGRVNAVTPSGQVSYLSVPNYDSFALGSTFTVSGWVKMTGTSGYPRLVSRKKGYTDANGWEFEMSSGSYVAFAGRGINNAPTYSGSLPTSLLNVWSHLVLVYDDATLSVYQNGALVKTGAITAATDNGLPLSFGCDSDGNEGYIAGAFDEFRLSDGCASADWIKADYDQIRTANFLTSSAALEVTADEPYWTDVTATAGFTDATVIATLAGLGTDATKAAVSIAYGTDPNALGEPTQLAAATAGYVLETTLTGLEPGTTYYYEITALNDANPAMSGKASGSFATKAYGKPTLTEAFVNGAEEIGFTATVSDVGEGASTVGLYFSYGSDAESLSAPVAVQDGLVAGDSYTKRLSDFENGVTIVYRWIAVNDRGVTNIVSGSATPGIDFQRPDVNVAEFSRGVKLTVTGYTETETLTNFPVLVRLSEGAPTGFSYADFYSEDGSDLVFLDAAGKVLAHEVDTWNPSGESLVWVQLPEMANGTEFSMWYRSSKSGDVFEKDPMWSAYWGVWHLGEGGDGVQTVADSTANALNGATHANSLAQPSGVIGAARRVSTQGGNSAANGQILIELNDTQKAALENMVPTFTFSAWFAFRSTGNGPDYAFLCSSKDNDRDPGWGIQFNSNASTAPGSMRVHSAGAADSQCATYSKAVTMRTWYKMNMVWDGTTYRAYYDGVQAATGTLYESLPAIMGTSGRISFGGMTGSGYGSFNGDMDEIRLKKGASSAAWIKAEYLNETTGLVAASGEVVTFTEKPKPIGTLALADFGAAYAQFTATLASLGEGATAAELQAKVWAADGAEPEAWTTIITDLAAGTPATAAWTGLSPMTVYNYKLRAVCNVAGANPSDVVESTFTTVGTGAAGVGGKVSLVGDDYVHTYNEYTRDFTFVPPAGVTSVEILLVGGGGAGGHTHGGGGAGGSVTSQTVAVTPGETYTVEIGAGGIASTAVGTASAAGGATSLKLGETVLATATGGQPGGNNTACNGGANDNFAAGVKNNSGNSGGGGAGAGQVGGAASNDSPVSGGSGGNGFLSSITGTATYYGGGGGGGTGTTGSLANPSSAGAGGLGGGGKGGGGNVANEADAAPAAGQNGLGGGGGGGAVTLTAYLAGANGGSGFAAIRYTIAGSGAGSATPRVSLDSATYAGDLKIDLGYRLGWAGAGADKAALTLKWGYTPTAITRTVAVADAVVGTGAYTFSAPLDETTYYFQLQAANGEETALSDAVLSVVVPKYAGTVPGDPVVPTLTGTTAVLHADAYWADVTGTLSSLGEGAATATVTAYLGLTEDVSLMTNQAAVAIAAGEPFVCRVADVVPDQTYYCYLEIANDLGAAISTPVVSFTTVGGSTLATPVLSSSQNAMSLTCSLLKTGAGTTDVYVSWDGGDYEKIASFTAESASTAFSSSYTVTEWKNVPWKLMCSNECTTVAGEMSGVYWTDLRTGTRILTDTSVYTWKQDDEGNWSGDWNDPAHWTSTQDVCLGYPNSSAATASFANCTTNEPVTVNVNGKYIAGTFTCAGTAASDIAFVGTGTSASQITCGNLPTAMKTGSKLAFKDLTLTRSYNTQTWYVCQQSAATDLALRFEGVSSTGISDFVLGSSGTTLEFVDSTVTFSSKFSLGGEGTTMIVDNTTLSAAHFLAPAEAPGSNLKVIFRGAAPKFTVTSKCGSWSSANEMVNIVFEVPEAGWTVAPIQLTNADAECMFAKNYSTGASKYLVAVSEDSPALAVTNTLVNVPLVTTKAGFYTDNMKVNDDDPYVTIPTNTAGEVCGEYAFSSEATPLSLSLVSLTGYEHAPEVDWDHPIAQTGTAGVMFGLTGAIAAADGAKLAAWAKGVGNVAFADSDDILPEAYLLNCANNETAIAASKAAFRFTSVTPGVVPTVSYAQTPNGTVTVKGSTDLKTWNDEAQPTDKFFKAELTF